jgi:hypothetical protein
LVQEELGRWRSVPPEEISVAVKGDLAEPFMLSLWMVETSRKKGEQRVVVHAIAVKQDGNRVPSMERQSEHYMHSSPSKPAFSPEQRIEIF